MGNLQSVIFIAIGMYMGAEFSVPLIDESGSLEWAVLVIIGLLLYGIFCLADLFLVGMIKLGFSVARYFKQRQKQKDGE